MYVYWSYNGSKEYAQLVQHLNEHETIQQEEYRVIDAGYLPLDTIMTDEQIIDHLIANPAQMGGGCDA